LRYSSPIFIIVFISLLFAQSNTRVSRVVDGDTFVISSGEKVRLIGVDTPETKHPRKGVEYFGPQASAFSREMLEGKTIRLEFDVQERDRYGRLLAYVYIDTLFFNKHLVKEGYARVATYPPNVKYQDQFLAAQRYAREHDKGLWGQDNPSDLYLPKESGDGNDTGPVVASKNSDKYHRPSCKWAKRIKPENLIRFESAEAARKKGYKPCKVCKP